MIDQVKLAILCFEEKGYHNSTLTELAQRTGLSLQEIERKYRTKGDLYMELFLYCRDSLLAYMKQSYYQTSQNPLEKKLYHIFKSLIYFLEEEKLIFCFFMRNYLYPPACLEMEIKASIQPWKEKYINQLRQLLVESMKSKKFNEVSIEAFVHSYIAFIKGNILLFINSQTTPRDEEIYCLWTTYWLSRNKNKLEGNEKCKTEKMGIL